MIPESGFLGMIMGATLGVQVVLTFLAMMSLWSWTIIFHKLFLYRRTKQLVSRGYELFNGANDLSEGLQAVSRDDDSPLGRVGLLAVGEFRKLEKADIERDRKRMRGISYDKFAIPLMGIPLDTIIVFTFVLGSAMQAVAEKQWSYVLSNNLRSSERGGESYDCVAYQEGYRSRLAFILRGHDTKPFGLIMLYSRAENYFSHYDHSFLSDCSRIVSLTVGSRLEVGRDALAKAAGGMAHVGNNALSVIKNCLELVKEDMELAVKNGSPQDLRKLAVVFDLAREVELIGCALGGVERLRGAIANLLSAVDNPRIMHYIRGEEVLDLDPNTCGLGDD